MKNNEITFSEGEGQIPAASAIITDLPAPLFDLNGRRIPPKGLQAKVCDPSRTFYLEQPSLDYAARYCRFDQTGLVPFISAADFEGRAKQLLNKLRENELTANLRFSVHLPIIIPPIVTPPEQVGDYGEMLEEFLLAAEKSCRNEFPERGFNNMCKGNLAGQVTIVPGSRHEQLIAGLASGAVVGIYFPNSLQKFSVDAQREQMETLPEGFLLSGGIDTAMGWVMYPDILARDSNTLFGDCSALQGQSSDSSFRFRATNTDTYFDRRRADLDYAYVSSSGGLLFVGHACR